MSTTYQGEGRKMAGAARRRSTPARRWGQRWALGATLLLGAAAASMTGCELDDEAVRTLGAASTGARPGAEVMWEPLAWALLDEEQPGSEVEWGSGLGRAELRRQGQSTRLRALEAQAATQLLSTASWVDLRLVDVQDGRYDAQVSMHRQGDAFWSEDDVYVLAHRPTARAMVGAVWGTDEVGCPAIVALLGGEAKLTPGQPIDLAELTVYAVYADLSVTALNYPAQ